MERGPRISRHAGASARDHVSICSPRGKKNIRSPRLQVGSNADSETSIWELQDKRVVVFHLVKWHRVAAGNVRDSSRTWWRQCLVSEEPFVHLDHPHGDYYSARS